MHAGGVRKLPHRREYLWHTFIYGLPFLLIIYKSTESEGMRQKAILAAFMWGAANVTNIIPPKFTVSRSSSYITRRTIFLVKTVLRPRLGFTISSVLLRFGIWLGVCVWAGRNIDNHVTHHSVPVVFRERVG